MRTLHNLSGGLDSTLCLWWDLQAGRKVVVHHCVLEDDYRRSAAEAEAVESIRSWLADRGHRFTYVETSVDLGTLGRIPFSDWNVVALMTGTLLRQRRFKDVTESVIPSHLDSYDPSWRQQGPQRAAVRDQIVQAVAGRLPDWRYPIRDMTKAQIVRAIPADLAELCWWCRTPDDGRPCRTCLTCRQVQAAASIDVPGDGCDR